MPRRMAFSKTIPQMRARTKDVTRRLGWADIEVGDVIIAIEKGQGLKKGECQVAIGRIRIVDVRIERLDAITPEDVEREGFPGMSPADFVRMFGKPGDSIVSRIEFIHLDEGSP